MLYTLPLSEAGTQLQDLVKRTRATHTPVLLTSEETAQPVAIVLEIDKYEQTQRSHQHYYYIQLGQLKRWLDQADRHPDDPVTREECITSWQQGLPALWGIAPQTVQEFCAGLMLSVKQMMPERLSQEQLAALRFALETLRNSNPSEAEKEEAFQLLIESGLPPVLSFDDDTLLQSYLEEL
ncbi:MAG: type II toxin-antitoxin system prevent-host-death family antitoxin [Caldilineaceae bacterium]